MKGSGTGNPTEEDATAVAGMGERVQEKTKEMNWKRRGGVEGEISSVINNAGVWA